LQNRAKAKGEEGANKKPPGAEQLALERGGSESHSGKERGRVSLGKRFLKQDTG